jgi:glycosyltransferase involved in cell wall biosynthesis
VRLLGVAIANEFLSEARVFATLLAHRGGAYDAQVVHQARRDERDRPDAAFRRFQAASGVETIQADFGWRDGRGVPLSLSKRALAAAKLTAAVLPLLPRLRAYRPDFIYSSQQRWDCQIATILARLLGVPQILHLHYNIGPWLHVQPQRRLRTADAVVCVSDFIRRQTLEHGVDPERSFTVHNSVSAAPETQAEDEALRKELGILPDALVVTIAARLVSGKGHADILRALSVVVRDHPAVVLLVAGEGELEGQLRAQVAELNLTGRVRFLGYRRDVPRLLSLSRVFIHPSLQEPCSLSVLEAAAHGVPTVAYADGGTPELVEEGTTGLLVPPGDVEGLARSLAALLGDAALARAMGLAARRHVAARFDPARQGRSFARILEETARRGAPAR